MLLRSRELITTLCLSVAAQLAAAQAVLPAPVSPVPSSRQLVWQSLEYSAFVHFGVNTFTDREWGDGAEPESLFHPTAFDAERIVLIFRDAGMRSVILTCKHHDGFCLWPSAFTEHSVKNSPWRNGTGDIVRDFAAACKKYGLKFGIYLSPWDRNHKDYGRPAYLEYFRAQLRELLTNYGEISEVWFDGANGGDGYYGGAREKRVIDPRSYYDWPKTWALVRQFQPNAAIFSDVGPDIRWVGNEEGYASETCWSSYTPVGEKGDEPAPGYTRYREAMTGTKGGAQWLPAECDVSIRPGWFYHAAENSLVRSPENLLNLYVRSVGRNASLLLNVPPDRRGLIATGDSAALMGFRVLRERCFSLNLVRSFTKNEENDSVWTALLDNSSPVNCVEVGESIAGGQRVARFRVERWDGRSWERVVSGTTIGHKRIIIFPTVTTDRLRIVIEDSTAVPMLTSVRAFMLWDDIHASLVSQP